MAGRSDILQQQFLELHSFAKNKIITVRNAKSQPDDQIYIMSHHPLSMIAFEQCELLKAMLRNISDPVGNGVWSFPWNNAKYSTKKVYLALTRAPEATAPFRWIWKSPCPPKQKFFFSG
jgi:hypothetical protein